MYLSTTDNSSGSGVQDGIYYLDPATINLRNTTNLTSTIRATLVHAASGYTDLGTNVWPVNTPLPVAFGNISASINANNQAQVNWETYTEKEVNTFEVEMSLDGKSFAAADLQKAKSANLAIKKYTSLIDIPAEASQLYFRIKATDFSGQYEHSKIVKVAVSGKQMAQAFEIYPNPVLKSMHLNLMAEDNTEATVELYNYTGKLLVKKLMQVAKGNNVLDLGNDIAELPTGIYQVSTIINGTKNSRQFVKQ